MSDLSDFVWAAGLTARMDVSNPQEVQSWDIDDCSNGCSNSYYRRVICHEWCTISMDDHHSDNVMRCNDKNIDNGQNPYSISPENQENLIQSPENQRNSIKDPMENSQDHQVPAFWVRAPLQGPTPPGPPVPPAPNGQWRHRRSGRRPAYSVSRWS